MLLNCIANMCTFILNIYSLTHLDKNESSTALCEAIETGNLLLKLLFQNPLSNQILLYSDYHWMLQGMGMKFKGYSRMALTSMLSTRTGIRHWCWPSEKVWDRAFSFWDRPKKSFLWQMYFRLILSKFKSNWTIYGCNHGKWLKISYMALWNRT